MIVVKFILRVLFDVGGFGIFKLNILILKVKWWYFVFFVKILYRKVVFDKVEFVSKLILVKIFFFFFEVFKKKKNNLF